jgi:hypothetical protein
VVNKQYVFSLICSSIDTNTMSIYLYKGSGLHGHLGIIMTDVEYLAIAKFHKQGLCVGV